MEGACKMKKTNAMRILDGLKIPYEVLSYEDDGEHKLELGACAQTAKKLGIPPETCFKTIVMRDENKKLYVFCQSAVSEINLKKARNASGAKEIAPIKPEELQPLTGYIRGGCSPLGMKKKLPTFIDESCLLYDFICVSAGQRGMDLKIAPDGLIKACGATAVDLVLD
jgi:Cys-tRNA(Pro)/Cys-tRNA(Cys) deacylase